MYFNVDTHVPSWNPPSGDVGFRYIDVAAGEEPPKGAQEKVHGMADPEGLGADWMNSQYQAPSVQRAEDHRQRVLFRGGEMNIWCDVDELSSMGIGTLLYFKLIRHLIWTFFIMTCLCCPILFSFSGTFEDVTNGATPFYLLTTRASTAAADCLRVQTLDSSTAYQMLCQSALNQTVVSVMGVVAMNSHSYSLLVSFLDAIYTV